jgi:DNA polymerase III subunit delta'
MSFNQIYGHEKKLALLKAAVLNNRIAHAYLFHGIDGVGKKTVARNFAKMVNCEEGGPDACDRCVSCLKVDHGHHPDLVTVEPEGQFIRIRQIREIQNQVRFSPLEGKARVFIVHCAERMNTATANALLKTLEEPVAKNILILISSRGHQMPATILSRCQRLRFNPLGAEVVAEFLEREGSLERTESALLAASCGGSIGKALEMKENAYVALKNAVLDRFIGLKDPLDFFSFLSEFGPEREDVIKRLEVLLTWHRDLLYCREGGEAEKLIHRDRADQLRQKAAGCSGRDLLANIKTISQTRRAIEQNASKQLALECMMFRLVRGADA